MTSNINGFQIFSNSLKTDIFEFFYKVIYIINPVRKSKIPFTSTKNTKND